MDHPPDAQPLNVYRLLVTDRAWTPDQHEKWVADLLPPTVIALVLTVLVGAAGSSVLTRAASLCPPTADVLKGVYHSERLTVLAPCP
jgi:hypothetical protein